MPTPLTRAQLLAAADEADAEAKRVRMEGEVQALALEAHAAFLRDAAAKGLTIGASSIIVGRKMQTASSPARPPRKVGRPVKIGHPFRTYLDGIGMNVKEWADANREAASTVKAWMRPRADGGRKIPEAIAYRIRDQAGKDGAGRWRLPVNETTWPNGIKP